eukprot:m.213684 g.213684  ORF g.213684 m.213684 type:complete len:1041 (+) comp33157_c0_seq1:465-3587(+)
MDDGDRNHEARVSSPTYQRPQMLLTNERAVARFVARNIVANVIAEAVPYARRVEKSMRENGCDDGPPTCSQTYTPLAIAAHVIGMEISTRVVSAAIDLTDPSAIPNVVHDQSVHKHALGLVDDQKYASTFRQCKLCRSSYTIGDVASPATWKCILGCDFNVCGICLRGRGLGRGKTTQHKGSQPQEHQSHRHGSSHDDSEMKNTRTSDSNTTIEPDEPDALHQGSSSSASSSQSHTDSHTLSNRIYDEDGWLWCADYDAPCCLRCGKRFRLGTPRHHCQCCGLAVCGDCSGQRLPSLPSLRICASCFKENMLRYDESFKSGVHTETVWVTSTPKTERKSFGASNIPTTQTPNPEKEDKNLKEDLAQAWEFVNLNSSHVRQPPSVLEMAVRPAPVAVLSGILQIRPQSLFGSRRNRYFVLDSNRMLASFSKFKLEPKVGAHTTDEFPTTIVNMEMCSQIKFPAKYMETDDSIEAEHLKLRLALPSEKFELTMATWKEAEDWYSSLCLAARICYHCGLPVSSSNEPDNNVEFSWVIATNMPATARLYHCDCFKCDDDACDRLESSPVYLLDRGRFVCGRHRSDWKRDVVSGAGLGTEQIAQRLARSSVKSEPRSKAILDKCVEISWKPGTKTKAKEIYMKWTNQKAQVEAAKRSRLHSRNRSPKRSQRAKDNADSTTLSPHSHLRNDTAKPKVTTREATARSFLTAATKGIVKMVSSLKHADPHDKSRMIASKTGGFEITEYSTFQFDYLRRCFSLTPTKYAESFQEIIDDNDEAMTSLDGGGSGSLLYLTQDRKYVVKTVSSSERDLMIEMLDDYMRHVETCRNSTRVCQIFGLYDLKFSNGSSFSTYERTSFIVMKNVLFTNRNIKIHALYDLKGSYVDRRAVTKKGQGFSKQFRGTLKDMDLRRPLRVGDARTSLVQQLTADVQFLSSLQIMDYSLLVGIHDCSDTCECESHFANPVAHSEDTGIYGFGDPSVDDNGTARSVYFVGIVDILQEWSSLKRTEAFVKSTILRKDPTGISAIEPEAYAKRLIDCMSGWFKDK